MDGQVRHRAPEGVQRTAAVLAGRGHPAVDGHPGRILAEAVNLGVVTHLDVQRMCRRTVGAGREQQRVPSVPISLSTCSL